MMKKITTIAIIFLFIGNFFIVAQCDCFKGEITDELIEYKDVKYGQNIQQGDSVDLHLDIYAPANNLCANPPLLMLFHGGAFIGGIKDDAAVVHYCQALARRGYVTASVQYRLTNSLEDMIKATFRAMHDGKAAIRYMRHIAQDSNSEYPTFDSNQIFAGGMSAGSFIAMNLAYFDEVEDLPDEWQQELYAVDSINPLEGNTNDLNYTTEVNGVINISGGVGFDYFLDEGDVPIISFHSEEDQIVPYNYGHPLFNNEALPLVYGSARIDSMANILGIPSELYSYPDGNHSAYKSGANILYDRLDSMINFSVDFLYPFIEDYNTIETQDYITIDNNTAVVDCSVNESCEMVCDTTILTTGINEIAEINANIYPNPITDHFVIAIANVFKFDWTLYDVNGKVVKSDQAFADEIKVNRDNLVGGIYFLKIEIDNRVEVHKLLMR